ncbi:uncharacterized protein LOC120200147 [Hibiscus syriacus]|uniref:uncharacterized protein LOC120200147 n=1 Tax=Hibiscus syriacus TaxID=106335 RepID=UPI001921A7ED|nr:uncharacterized protein LOC120200147 [Hibiscus syriacus]
MQAKILCLHGILVVSLLFSGTKADTKIKQVTDPTGNVNLSPFQQWESAYECLQNKSQSCSDIYTLTEAGWMNVTSNDATDFCKAGGCGEHTKAVLTCIHHVKRDYKFINKATVWDLKYTITHGCTSGFNGTTYISNARRRIWSPIAISVSVLAAVFLLKNLDDWRN